MCHLILSYSRMENTSIIQQLSENNPRLKTLQKQYK